LITTPVPTPNKKIRAQLSQPVGNGRDRSLMNDEDSWYPGYRQVLPEIVRAMMELSRG